MKNILSLVASITVSVTGFATAVTPYYLDRYELDEDAVIYRSDFDEPDALDQPGWSVDQGQATLVDDGIEGSCIRVEPSPEGKFGQVTFKLDPPPNLPVLFIDFHVKPVAFSEGPEEFADVAGSVTGAFRLVKESDTDRNTAALYVLNGNGKGDGDWVDTGHTFELDDEGRPINWMRLTFRQEFQRDDVEGSQSRWDLWVDGRLVGIDMGYYDTESLDPGRITLLGHRHIPLLLDNLTVASENPLFVDANSNGVIDGYERIYGLVDRDSDLDQDGLTNSQEYLLRTNPTAADTDNDGLNDAEEHAAVDRDPNDPSDTSEVALQQPATIDVGDANCSDGSVYMTLNLYGVLPTDTVSFEAFRQDGTSINAWHIGPFFNPYNPYYGSTSSETIFGINGFNPGDSGEIVVTADIQGSEQYGTIYWECDGCDESCGSSGGCFSYSLGSFRSTMDLGELEFGDANAKLKVYAPEWSDDIFNRVSVRYHGPKDEGVAGLSKALHLGAEVDVVDWVRMPGQFVKLEDIPNGYAIERYTLDQVDIDNRVTGEPFHRVEVFNPDPSDQSGIRRVQIVENGEKPISREYRFYRLGGQEIWEEYAGSHTDFLTRPLRYERLVIDGQNRPSSYQGDSTYTKRKETGRWDPDQGTLVIDNVTKEVRKRHGLTDKVIRFIKDPDGQALSTEYGYNQIRGANLISPSEDTATWGKIKRQWVEHPDGDWEWYGYDDKGRRNRTVRPIGNTPRPNTLPQAGPGYLTEERIYEVQGFDVQTTYTRAGNFERRHFARYADRVENGQFTNVEVLTYDINAAADDPSNEVTTTIRAANGNLLRLERPDGTVTENTYTIEGDERTKVSFTGLADRSAGTIATTVTHRSGVVLSEKVVDVETQVLTRDIEVAQLDERFRPTMIADGISGDILSKGYDCCGVGWQTAGDGSTTVYQRDLLGRTIAETTGYKSPLDLGNALTQTLGHQSFTLDSQGRRIQVQEGPHADTLSRSSSTEYNLAGQRTSTLASSGVETEFKTVMLEDGGRLELTSLPRSGQDDRHRITSREYAADGNLRRSHTYASGEPFATEPDPGTTVSHMLYEEGTDANGRYKQTTSIANIFDRRATRTYLDAEGRQKEVIHAYGTKLAASEFFDYNADGDLIRHIDSDGATTRYAYNEKGERIITAIDLKIEPNEAPDHIDYEVDRITKTTTEIKVVDGSAVQRSTTEVFTEKGTHIASVSEQSLDGAYSATTQNGHPATRRRIDSPIAGTWQVINTQPNGAHTIQAYENGRLTKTTRHDADGNPISWIAQTYDDDGRPYQITDSRTGTTTRHYDENGRVWKISAPNPQTASSTEGTLDTVYHFDALGQVLTTVKPSGGEVHNVYNANGTLAKVHGYHTTDVEYRYNGRGERTQMFTFYGVNNDRSRTRWQYDARGQLAYKQDAAGKRVRYTYTPGGKLKTRTWARGVVTTYLYDEDNRKDLRHIGYSDTTPDVHFTYTRLGQQQTVQDAGGLLTYDYRETNPLELESETRSAGDVGQSSSGFSRRSGDTRNGANVRAAIRQNSINSDNSVQNLYSEPKVLSYLPGDHGRSAGFRIGTSEDPDQDYEVRYAYDRVGRLASVSSMGYHFNYGYLPSSTTDRLESTTAMFVKKTTYDYEPGRDTLTSVTNHVGFNTDQLLSRYTYDYRPDGQRMNRTSEVPSQDRNVTDRFVYDPDTGGVISSERDNTDAESYSYQYDKIGNRLEVSEDAETTQYEPNNLNQYRSIQPSDSSLAARLSYDADGNQLTKGNQTFVWDAENRLIEMRERGSLVAHYSYDHQSRRIARRVPSLNIDERYLYQAWNLIAVYRAGNPEPEERYTWGKDLSGTLQGAGGVGGLLFAKKRSVAEDTWIYHYDANGNVSELTASAGNLLDQYQYDAFGQALSAPATANRYLFSTKPTDRESAFHYYGYRFYDSASGRWLSRDPIGEFGGLNLYGFCSNNSKGAYDLIGAAPKKISANSISVSIDPAEVFELSAWDWLLNPLTSANLNLGGELEFQVKVTGDASCDDSNQSVSISNETAALIGTYEGGVDATIWNIGYRLTFKVKVASLSLEESSPYQHNGFPLRKGLTNKYKADLEIDFDYRFFFGKKGTVDLTEDPAIWLNHECCFD